MSVTAATMLTVELPLPPREAGPNGRVHWREKARIVKNLRSDANSFIREAMDAAGVNWWEWSPWNAARLDICWRFAGPQPDADNCISRMKAQIDGAADALGMNDRNITIGSITFQRVKRAEQRVVLTFTRVGEEPT